MLVSEESNALMAARVGAIASSPRGPANSMPVMSRRSGASAIQLTVHENLAAVEATWRAFEIEADCTAFQTFAWHDAWQRTIGDRTRARPAIVEGRDGGRLLFIMPLAVEHGLLARRLVWHASDLCDYNQPLLASNFFERVPAEGFAALWDEIGASIRTRHSLGYDVVILEGMPESIGGHDNPFRQLRVTPHSSSAYMMRIAGDWDTFYRDKRSSATRRHDRSKRKRLAESGAVSFTTAATACDAEITLDAFFAQKAASFAARGVPNFLARPGTRDFYRAVASDPSLSGIVHVSRLQVGSLAAAANLGMVFRGRYYHILASYDGGAISRFGPGTAHLHALIDYALQRGCTEFDFTVGDEPYKRDWCDQVTRLYDFRGAQTLRGGAVVAGARVASRVKRSIKHSPLLWRVFTAARLLTAPVRRRSHPIGPDAVDRGASDPGEDT
jgi:CelD/BcsL family acetyltransferase involved in cellulose biosynthesis